MIKTGSKALCLPMIAFIFCMSTTMAGARSDDQEKIRAEAAASFIFIMDDATPTVDVPGKARRLIQEHGGKERFLFTKAIKGFSATMTEAEAERLVRKNPFIRYYEKNGVVQTTESVSAEAIGRNRWKYWTETIPTGVSRVGGPYDGTGKHAWIIDTGIDLDNSDLNVGTGATFVVGSTSPDDMNGHGTHVAGTVAAKRNGAGVVGVAANATVHPVQVLNAQGSGTIDAVIAGINYVAANGKPGDAVNMSLSATGHYQSLHDAVTRAANLGLKFAVAAGNSSSSAANFEPAHVEHPNVYTVSAVDQYDIFATFSNFSNPPVDFAAPGVNVVSLKVNGGTIAMSGTSMATPHVCGILLFQVPVANGTAINDPDGISDAIAHF